MYKGYRFIDSDSHVLEPPDLWQRYLEPEFLPNAPIHACEYRGDPPSFHFRVQVGEFVYPNFKSTRAGAHKGLKEVYGEYIARGFDLQCYTMALDRTGIDHMVLYPTAALYPPATPTLSSEVAAAYRAAGNNWLHDFCSAADGRIHGAGMVDLRDPDEAMREARRCVRRLGFRAIGITPEPVTKMALHDPFYDALWAVIADLGVPLAIHQSAGTYTQVGMDYYPNWGDGRGVTAHTIGNMLACASMTAGGVLERHPNLRVVFLESGCGWVPFWLDRLSAGTAGGYREKALTGLSMTPIESFRRQCFVSADPDDPGVGDVVRTLGDGVIVTATDFSHPEGRGYVHALDDVLGLPDISDETKRKIMWDNPARLYALS